MSIIWLESFYDNQNGSNIFLFQSLNIVLYLNMISCICFVIYCLLYNMDPYMQKPPSNIYLIFRYTNNIKNVW